MLLKYLKLGLIYSKDFLVFSMMITILSYFILIQSGTSSIGGLIWLKILTTLIGIIVHNKRKPKEIFFYMNNGLGEKELVIYTIIVDLVIWIFGLTMIIKFIL